MENKIKFNEIDDIMLLRSGFRETVDSPRYLVYHLTTKQKVEKLIKKNLANKQLSNKDIIVTQMLNEQANHLEMYMTLFVKDGENKKFIHIEKDETVTLTNKPTCFFEVDLFEENSLKDYKKMIQNTYEKSDVFKQYGSFKTEKITNRLFNAIKNKPADMNY